MLCTAPDTNTLKANREGGRPVPSTLGAERERPGAARSSPVAAGLGQGVRSSGTAPHPARPGGWLPGMQNPARAIELSLGRQTRAHGGLRACLPLTAGRESILAWPGCGRAASAGRCCPSWISYRRDSRARACPWPGLLCWPERRARAGCAQEECAKLAGAGHILGRKSIRKCHTEEGF